MLLKNGLIYQDGEFRKKDIRIMEGKILEIGTDLPEMEEEILEIQGFRVIPGFVEIHMHGAVGVDVNAADAEGFEKIGRFLATQGVTGWLCSILTDTEEQTLKCIHEYRRWKELPHWGAELMGIHLEGPFLGEKYKGAMPPHLLRDMDLELLKRYQQAAEGEIRYITVSPERAGVLAAIPEIRKMGIQVAIGHSDATYDQAMQAIRQGAGACTHTFNAMRLFHQHEPAIMGAALESDIYCEAICDGIHLHPGSVRLLLKTKSWNRVVAVADSIMATGFPDGQYKLGVNDVIVKDGDAKLMSDGTRAGSVLTAAKAFQNLIRFTGENPERIIPLFTENPACLLGLERKKGYLKEKRDADFVIVDEKYRIQSTFVKAKKVF